MAQNEEFDSQWNEFDDLHQRLRANIQSMAHVKKKLLSKHKEDVKAGKKERDRLYDDTCKIFTYLKSLHQKSLVRRETAQRELNNLCKSVDSESLDVKNFEYDQMDTMKQIAICNNYRSHPNEPKLVSKQQFYAKHPRKEIDDIHQEKTLRLQYELVQRKELQNDLRDMTQTVKTHSSELDEKQRFLNNLQSKIGNVFEAIKPLQKYMNLPSAMIYPNESEIDCLPAPLFAIYQSFTTQIHCDDTLDPQIKLTIIKRSDQHNAMMGNKNKKKSVLGKRKFATNDDSTPSVATKAESKSDNNLEDGEIGSTTIMAQEPPRKKARTSSKSNRSSKDKAKTKAPHSKKSRTKNTSKVIKTADKEENENKNETMSTELNKWVDCMTLSVEFKPIGIQLEFMYCDAYKLVLVAVKRKRDTQWKYEDGTLFMDLFDGHRMIELPAALQKEQRLLDNGCRVPYFSAFSWAQELSGCYVFGAKSNTARQRDIVNLNSLQLALKQRKEHRISLQNQLKQLMVEQQREMFIGSMMAKAFGDASAGEKRKTPVNKLLSFKHTKNEKYNTYFELVLERKPFSLYCTIEIGASYPQHAPLFYVKDIRCSQVERASDSAYFVNECKNIEIKLNGEFTYVNDRNKHLLLSMMIYRLQLSFDVYVDAQTVESNRNSSVNQSVRIHRGRDRRQQY